MSPVPDVREGMHRHAWDRCRPAFPLDRESALRTPLEVEAVTDRRRFAGIAGRALLALGSLLMGATWGAEDPQPYLHTIWFAAIAAVLIAGGIVLHD